MRLSDENLRGRSVIAADGKVIGQVSGFFIDSDGWSLDALEVALRKESADQIGASRSMFRAASIEIPVRMVQSIGETVVLAVPVDDLRKSLPGEAQLDAH